MNDWRHRAACKNAPPELFDRAEKEPAEVTTANEDLAISVYCNRCPVQRECLQHAISMDRPPSGVWGGLRQDERLAGRKKGRSNRAIKRALQETP